MPRNSSMTMITSSKTRNCYIHDIIYSICEDNIFKNKKEIKFISIIDRSFKNGIKKFCRGMELINAAVKPYHIEILKKQLNKVDLQNAFHGVD